MLESGNQVRLPDREALVAGEGRVFENAHKKPVEVEGLPEPDQIFDWLDSDMTVDRIHEELQSSGDSKSDDIEPSRKLSGWDLSVDNKIAELTGRVAIAGYKFGMIMMILVVMYKLLTIINFVPALPEYARVWVMSANLIVTLGAGLFALGMLFIGSVSKRGPKFRKRVVQLSSYSILLVNSVVFVMLFSEFSLPDFSFLNV